MIIEIDEKSGFCFGVVNAITKAEESLAEAGNVFCLGDIVHNRIEVSRLEAMGLKTIKHDKLPDLRGETVLIRAHGEPPSTYEAVNKSGIRVIDATCPVVSDLQKKVKNAYAIMQSCNGQLVILGKKGHAEVVGLTGQVRGKAIVIEKPEDLDALDFSRPIYLLSQTTQSLELFGRIKDEINRRICDKTIFTVNDTICRNVSNRNPHLRNFASRFDVIIFVSGKKSSNGEALFQTCKASNSLSYKIEDEREINPDWFKDKKSVGICGATSTPKWLMQEIADYISNLKK